MHDLASQTENAAAVEGAAAASASSGQVRCSACGDRTRLAELAERGVCLDCYRQGARPAANWRGAEPTPAPPARRPEPVLFF